MSSRSESAMAPDSGPGARQLVDEAVHILRQLPLRGYASYLLGTLPFLLLLLFFASDMSRGAYAERRCLALAIALTLAFVWMKTWQAVYMQGLRCHLLAVPPAPLTLRRWLRLARLQAMLHSWGTPALALSALASLAAPWCYAFLQNTLLEGGGDSSDSSSSDRLAISRAWQHTTIWPKQNYTILSIISGVAIIVFINSYALLIILPKLLQTFTGIETVFTQSHYAVLNTTFFLGVVCLTYLIVDPLSKAVYTLRAFYADSQTSGVNERLRLRRIVGQRSATTLLLTMLLLLSSIPSMAAAAAPAAPEQLAPKLDQTISEVVNRPQYAWRMPRWRANTHDLETGPRFIKVAFDTVAGWLNSLHQLIKDLFARLQKLFPQRDSDFDNSSNSAWLEMLYVLLAICLTAVVSCLLVLLIRRWRGDRRGVGSQQTPTLLETATPPDLRAAEVNAMQLPMQRWLTLADELAQQGDWQLALRAVYLAMLAFLANQQLLTLARHKSNADYIVELQRRSHALPGLQPCFVATVGIFDRIWYGRHPVSDELFARMRQNLQRIIDCAS